MKNEVRGKSVTFAIRFGKEEKLTHKQDKQNIL